MPVSPAKPGPYAPTSTLLDVVTRYRDNLPKPITAEVLARAGIPESLIPRTLQSLQTLDLIDKDGAPTQTLEGLRLAPEAEYRAKLAAWVRSAYADIIVFADPAKADSTRVRDAFRGYEPRGQQARMVSLFLGLCAAAGISAEKPVRTAPTPPTFTPRQRTAAKRIVNERFKDAPRHPSGVPAPLAGVLAKLPAEGDSWTKADRAKFIAAFNAMLDFCFPVVEHDDAARANDGQTIEDEALETVKTALRRRV